MQLDSISQTLGHNLRIYRNELELTQLELAKKSKISFRSYQQLESGKGNPTLHTIHQLAKTLEITVGRLLSLSSLRINCKPESFISKFQIIFDSVSIGAGIRTLDGNVLYVNRSCFRISGMKPENKAFPIDLLEMLYSGAKEILRVQLALERRGNVFPYLNFVNDLGTGEKIFIRYYPCLILPETGKTPFFSALYMTEVSEDCQKNYYDFCRLLLNCI